jgi:hypothetical protein
MNATGHTAKLDGSLLLVEHCLALGFAPGRPSALDRLEQELGSDFTRRLVLALTRMAEPAAA